MTRTRFLVCYDIADPRRLRRVAKALKAYGTRLQYSVFECALDDQRLEQAKADIDEVIQHDEDQVLFVSLGESASDQSLKFDAIGKPYDGPARLTIV